MPTRLKKISRNFAQSGSDGFSNVLSKWLGGAIFIGVVLLISFVYKSWREETRAMQDSLAIQAGLAAKSSQAVFDKLGASLELLGWILKEHRVLDHPETIRPILNEFQVNHPGAEAVSIVTINGATLINTAIEKGAALPDFRSDPEYFRQFLFDLNNTYSYNIGLNQYGHGLNKWHFPVRHVVLNKQGDPLFVVQAAVSVDITAMLWANLPLYPDSRVGLLRYDGWLQLLWPIAEHAEELGQPHSGILSRTLKAHPGVVAESFHGISGLDQVQRVGAYARLPDENMVAFVSVPESLIFLRWWQHNYAGLLSLVLYLILIGLVTLRLRGREKLHTQQLIDQSRRDALTGLPNRLAIGELINLEVSRSRRNVAQAAVLYLDLDRFKDVNDSLGHVGGDLLLMEVANRLRAILRREDHLARLGGDEFLILLPDRNLDGAAQVAERVLQVFQKPFDILNGELRISSSIGVCILPQDGDDIDTLLQNADAAMYEAKRHGRNHYALYQQALGDRIRERLNLQNNFKRALELEQFVLHYQPLVDMPSGKIVGAEALVRWNDPKHGLRGPADFIACAEESGLILPLGEWVLRAACRQCKTWEKAGYPLRIAVNLSTRQFQDPQLLHKIRQVLEETELAATKLELEITESAAMQDPEASIAVMNKLKALGIRFSIDDFGTGYSSLGYLKRLPADIIKIDRSFVREIHNRPDDFAIVRTILALGDTLEKHCLAEGIESSAQFDVLCELGCDYGQGYWISRPVPAPEFAQLLAQENMPVAEQS